MTKSTSPDKATQATNAYSGPVPASDTSVDNSVFSADGIEIVKTDAPTVDQTTESTVNADPKTNKGILGESTEALGADTASLLETTDTGKKRYASLSEPVEPMAQPDNSPEGLDHNKRLTNARAFVRGQGFADHLYSDASVMSEHDRYMAWSPANYGKNFDMNLEVVQTYFNTPKGGVPEAVKKAEYATTDGAQVPHYKDQERADTSTPAVPELPNKA